MADILSQYVEEGYALELLSDRAGGVGYLLRDGWPTSTASSTRCGGLGPAVLDPEVVAQRVGRRRRDDPLSVLTPREREVLALMAEGRKLGLAPAPDDHREYSPFWPFCRTEDV